MKLSDLFIFRRFFEPIKTYKPLPLIKFNDYFSNIDIYFKKHNYIIVFADCETIINELLKFDIDITKAINNIHVSGKFYVVHIKLQTNIFERAKPFLINSFILN